jgi:phosphate starvation-inducible protein PhoH
MSDRRQIELSNDVAAALSGTHDAVLRQLEEHVDCELYLRGNLVTLEGDAEAVANAAVVVRELAELIEGGHEITPGTLDAVTSALDEHESPAKVLDLVELSEARELPGHPGGVVGHRRSCCDGTASMRRKTRGVTFAAKYRCDER